MKNLKKATKQPAKKKARKNRILIIIGLGNPGVKYRGTRHNAGFAVIDCLSEKYNVSLKKTFLKPYKIGFLSYNNTDIYLVKPLTYMNRSGDILGNVLKRTGTDVEDMILVCDNMDLEPGMIRLKKKGSSAGHNGIKSVIANLGTADFKRLYIGVGRRSSGEGVIEHVLGKFEDTEKKEFDEAIEKAAETILMLTEQKMDLVMNGINKKKN